MAVFAPITLLRDDRGAVALIAAFSITMIMGVAALAVDAGSLYLAKRQLQAATDMAALSATYAFSEGASAATLAGNYINKNITGATQVTAITGIYCPDSSLSTSGRFTASGISCANNADLTASNAVKVSASIASPLFFARILLPGTASETISTTSTAAQINEAGFYAGTGLLSLNNGLINSILNGLLPGSNISLNAVSYNGLLNANISALGFLNALATNLNVTAGTYGSLLQSSVGIGTVLQSEIDALNAPGSVAVVALNSLKLAIPGSYTVNLSKLLDLGVWQNLPVGSANTATALSAALNAYQFASLTAQAANGANFVNLNGSSSSPLVSIPGLAQVTVAATAIEPQQSAYIAFGPVGATVHTSQVRLQLTLTLLDTATLLGQLGSLASINASIPLYVEVASGTATLSTISCGYNPLTDATVTIAAQPAAISAYLGTAELTSNMTNFTSAVPVPPATNILNLSVNVPLVGVVPVLSVTAKAQATLGSPGPTSLLFTQANMTATPPTTQTTSSTNMLSTLSSTLSSNLVLTPTILGALPLPIGNILSLVSGLLTPVFASVDQLVDPVLAALGIRVGYMDVTATGVRCGVPTLVY